MGETLGAFNSVACVLAPEAIRAGAGKARLDNMLAIPGKSDQGLLEDVRQVSMHECAIDSNPDR
ncbi:hypothetical protein ACL7TT_07615 [Microbulbifer sp. 2304DJ12-6]|uniref:hypothetical protein n=1 Tax=Microbulbifer sp. 2304DJ12-6 TaxID=3233340 RepID=UPI00263224A9|nr:hypothetical protein [uncultured Microbulbifer sp.]